MLFTMLQHVAGVEALAVSQDSNLLYTASRDSLVKRWVLGAAVMNTCAELDDRVTHVLICLAESAAVAFVSNAGPVLQQKSRYTSTHRGQQMQDYMQTLRHNQYCIQQHIFISWSRRVSRMDHHCHQQLQLSLIPTTLPSPPPPTPTHTRAPSLVPALLLQQQQ